MHRCLALTLGLIVGPLTMASADQPRSEPIQSEEAWLRAVRGSGSYRHGMDNVEKFITAAYDLGAIAGATHWEDIHDYYIQLARAKGCQKGKAHASGPVKACHKVSGTEPKVVAKDYQKGKAKTLALAKDTLYPDLVERVLVVLYDYGYVQGMKHGLRVHNDDIRLAQTYYRACMARANDAEGEGPCAKNSKAWADALLARLVERIEAHGLPARSKPP